MRIDFTFRRGTTSQRRRADRRASGPHLASGIFFATSVTVCMVPISCGASDDYAASPQQGTQPSLPAIIVDELVACAKEGVGRLEHNAYEIRFDIDLDGEGAVRRVIPGGTRLDDERLEGCMMDALRAMPSEFLSDGAPSPLSSTLFPRHARGLMGNVTVLPQIFELAPIVIASGGVTIVVMVAILVVAAAVSVTNRNPTAEECKKLKEDARKFCEDLMDMQDPPLEVIGPYKTMWDCIASNLHHACGGKQIEHEKSPRYDDSRPGRRF